MDTKQVEIILHIDDTLPESDRNEIVDDLQGVPGVSHAHFTPNKPHLVVVDYDPERLHAADVLDCVCDENVQAELIGGV